MATERQTAHELVERLEPNQLAVVVRLLEVMIDADADSLSEEDRRAVAASREYFRQDPNGGVRFEQLATECGFTMDQIHSPKAG